MQLIETVADNVARQASSLADLLDTHLIDATPRILLRFEARNLDQALALRILLERKFNQDLDETETFCAAFWHRNVQIWITCLATKVCHDNRVRGIGDLRDGRDFATTV